MPEWNSLETAARVRDVLRAGMKRTINEQVDRKLIGRCINVDIPSLKAQVWFPGDDGPTDVKLFSSTVPATWEKKGFPAGSTSTSTNGFGGMVSVEEFDGSLYITDVLTGGTINVNPQSTSNVITPIGADSAPQNPYYTTLSVNIKQSVNIAPGGGVIFGPFRRFPPNLTTPGGGAVKIIVESPHTGANQYDSYRVYSRTYEFNFDSFGDHDLGDEFSSAADDPMTALPHFHRLIPHQIHQFNSQRGRDEYDLDFGVRRTVNGGATTLTPTFEIWMRMVNMRPSAHLDASHQMDYTITIMSSAMQNPLGIDNKFSTFVDTLIDPPAGYAGFHSSHGGLFVDDDYVWLLPAHVKDNFGRQVTGGLGSNYRNYAWDANSQCSVADRATISLAAANTEQGSFLAKSAYGQEIYAEFDIAAVALGQPVKFAVRYNRSTNTSFFWAACHLETGGTMSYSINRRTSGADTTLASGTVNYQGAGLTYAANTKLCIWAQYVPGGTHKVSIWKRDTQFQALADVYTYATDATYPGYNAPTSTAGMHVSQATGGSNTYPLDVHVYLFEARLSSADNDFDTYSKIFYNDTQRIWSTGPWRTSLLRTGELLQRMFQWTDMPTWDGTYVKWPDKIILGGIGSARHALKEGCVWVGMPGLDQDGNTTGIMNISSTTSTTLNVNASGIPLLAGQSLWVGIKPGTRYQDLRQYLFIIDNFGNKPTDVPEWAVLIAYRPVEGLGKYIVMGNGQEVYVDDAVDNGTWGVFAGTTTENAGNYTNMGAPASFSFTKLRSNTRVEIDMSGTFQTSVTSTGGQFGVRINSVDYDIARLAPTVAAANAHLTYSGKRIISRTTVPAGTYTIQGRMKRLAGAGTITTDADDNVSINAREIA